MKAWKKWQLWTIVVVFLVLLSVPVGEVFATSCEGVQTSIIECGDDESGIGHILSLVINIFTVGVGVLGAVGIVLAGIQYLTAGGNEEKTRKAKRRIFELVIGLVVYVVFYAFLQWLMPGGIPNPSELPHFEIPEPDTSEHGGGSGGGADEKPEPQVKYAAGFSLEKESGMEYWLNVPNNATNGMPLVVFLHGDGEMGSSSAVKGLPEVTYMANSSRPYISIAPVGSGSDWSSNSKQNTLMTLINKVVNEYKINKNKIYLMGFSRGAIGTWDLVSSNPNYFAAAVPISCCPSSAKAANFKHTKIYAMAGGAEGSYISCMQSFVNQINSSGGSAKFESYGGQSHESMQGALRYDEIFSWLLKQ